MTTLQEPQASQFGQLGAFFVMQPPIPTPNETQPQFAVRFHEATKELIPSTEERNAQCLRYWRVHRGGADPLESKARDRFEQREL